MKFKLLPFIISMSIPLGVGAIGGLATASEIGTWYSTLQKPSFNPPNWIFGPVWTTLYVLMGIAAHLVWQRRHEVSFFPKASGIYAIQLLLNLAWSFIFFRFHLIGLAFGEIILLLVVIIVNAAVFYRIDKWAGLLFAPYIFWVAFASLLNHRIFVLN